MLLTIPGNATDGRAAVDASSSFSFPVARQQPFTEIH